MFDAKHADSVEISHLFHVPDYPNDSQTQGTTYHSATDQQTDKQNVFKLSFN